MLAVSGMLCGAPWGLASRTEPASDKAYEASSAVSSRTCRGVSEERAFDAGR